MVIVSLKMEGRRGSCRGNNQGCRIAHPKLEVVQSLLYVAWYKISVLN